MVRRIVAALSAVIMNSAFANYLSGSIYKGPLKYACVPGLNCYSCPGAWGSCPIGALQAVITNVKFLFSFYIVGYLLLAGVLFGRLICGWLCPFGLIQELLYKIPSPKIKKSKATRALSKLKYAVFAVFVIALPLIFLFDSVGVPAFCKFICPAGTLEAGVPLIAARDELHSQLGLLFALKIFILVITILMSVAMFRPFCRFLCPLGAVYAVLGRISVFGIRPDKALCKNCGRCTADCKMDARRVADSECIRCGKCSNTCPHGAIVTMGRKKHPAKTVN